MVPGPTYSQFQRDFADRAEVRLVPAPMNDYHLQFHRDHRKDLVLALEKAYKFASQEGIHIKALLICNPEPTWTLLSSRDTDRGCEVLRPTEFASSR